MESRHDRDISVLKEIPPHSGYRGVNLEQCLCRDPAETYDHLRLDHIYLFFNKRPA